jgi:predicted MFS family arabinose efflux permease
LLGALCAAVSAAAWRPLSIASGGSPAQEEARAPRPLALSQWTLVACYCAFGFGYIIPATFIPAVARALVNDPAVFGWAWPLFGVAAAASTLLASTALRGTAPRRVAAGSLAVMAGGVIAPLIHTSVASLLVSALCVGSTFMVMTMAATQEARRIAAGSPTRLIAALTVAFALGQIAGPLLVGFGSANGNTVALASGVAAALLLSSAALLRLTDVRAPRAADPLIH